MSATNPYASPTADLNWDGEVSTARDNWLEKNFLWLLFSPSGRLPRLGYWGASLVVSILQYSVLYFSGRFIHDPAVLLLVQGSVAIPVLWATIAISAKRYHDRDKSGWWLLLMFVPIIGPLWILVELGFLRGSYGDNSYGQET